MAARFKKNKPMGGQRVPVGPDVTSAYTDANMGKRNMPLTPPPSNVEKGSAAIWALLSAIGGQFKDEFGQLKNDPLGTTGATLDSLIMGQESRDRFKQGDYAGAINYSGLGKFAALPELDNIFRGKGSPSDLASLALTYGTGGIGKVAKTAKAVTMPAKQAVKKGSNKAMINILSRLK